MDSLYKNDNYKFTYNENYCLRKAITISNFIIEFNLKCYKKIVVYKCYII